MRRLLSYCLLLLLLFACIREEVGQEGQWDGPVMTLTLDILEDIPSKAEGEVYEQLGDNAYHENDIKWVDFYFYPQGQTGSNATYHRHEVLSKLTRNSASFRFELTTEQVNSRIFPTQTETTEAIVFALVNVDPDRLALDDTSLESLKQVLVTTDFDAYTSQENHRQQSFMMSGETTIRLRGRTKKEVIEDEGSRIQLSRYACKITVGIKAKDRMPIQLYQSDGTTPRVDAYGNPVFEEWTPCLEEMKIYLADGIKTVSLGGEPVDIRTGKPDGYETLSYKNNPLDFYRNIGTEAEPVYEQLFDVSNGYYNTYPSYTYPQHWKNGNEGEPYLKLVLPWERTSSPENEIAYAKKEFYYKILIPNDVRSEYTSMFVRNNWYHYNIDVGMLGADTDDTEVEIQPIDCYVYYWQDKNVVVKRADIGHARYLSPTQNRKEYVLNNESHCKIGFTTSHPLSYQVSSVTRPFYGEVKDDPSVAGFHVGDAVGEGIIRCYDPSARPKSYYLEYDASAWFSLEGSSIVMDHPLDNNYSSSTFDYSPYTMSVTVWHADQDLSRTEYKTTIQITQNPAIYIQEELNSDPQLLDANGEPVAGDDTLNNTETNNGNRPVWPNYAHAGYVFYDGARLMRHRSGKKDDGEYGTVAKKLKSTWANDATKAGDVRQKLEWLQWRTVNFTGGNRCRYTIHVSVLDKNSKYIIGDPRTRTPQTWNNGEELASTILPSGASESPDYCYWYNSEDPYHYWEWSQYYDGYPNPYHPDDPVVPFERDADADEHFVVHFRPAHVIDNKTGSKRELTYYYPAENSNRTEKMLAPALRVSSRFGGVEFYNGITRRSAEFKCATYQEDGYPAGRWRLPTRAEIDFIGTITKEGGFVQLFGNTYYWSANGAVQPNGDFQRNRDYALVRCVYDAWYWDPYEDRLPEAERDNYYFGDLPR